MTGIRHNWNVPCSQVARHICVSDVHYFSKLFKKYTGVSPKDYVKKYDFLTYRII
ncbi:MAG: AraC family transcriptional regulator, partial [bacterium]|nr:AraC family transcriptional regulator [bacterium]